jgi:hypothetical protein
MQSAPVLHSVSVSLNHDNNGELYIISFRGQRLPPILKWSVIAVQ